MRLSLISTALAASVLLALPNAAPAASSSLVINEIEYDQPGSDTAEYLEVRNVSPGPIALGDYALRYVNGADNSTYRTTPLGSVDLAAGDFYVVCVNPATTENCDLDGGATQDMIQNGAPDAVALVKGTTIVDTVSYEGIVPGYAEGLAPGAPADTGATAGSGIARVPDGCDTDVNSADFRVAPDTPGASNGGVPCDAPPPADDAPEVSSTDPRDGAADVDRESTLAVTFSEPVTAQDDAFALTCGASSVALAVTRDGADAYTLDPQSTLPEGAVCTLAVDGDRYRDDDTVDPPDTGSDHTTRFTTVGATGLRIHDIQAAAHLSPYQEDVLTRVPGVVTAVRGNGFYMQDPEPDDSDATSEGIFVFTDSAPTVVRNAAVEVSGTVHEFRAGCQPTPCAPTSSAFDNLTVTELDRPTVYPGGTAPPIAPTIIGEDREPPLKVIEDDTLGNVEIDNALFDPAQDGIDFHESLEGMLVEIPAPEVVGPTNDFGEIPVVTPGFATPRTQRGGVFVTEDDLNPERFILDDMIVPTPDADVGDALAGPVEAIGDYGFANYKYLVTGTPAVIPGPHLQREVTEAPRANQLAIASMNVENLDPTDPPSKFTDLASIVVDNLRSPDILAVEEVQDNNGPAAGDTDATVTYTEFIETIAALGGPTYEFHQINPINNADGGEPNGNIRVGFLLRTDRGLEFVDRPGGTATNRTDVVATHKGARLTFSPGRLQDDDATTFASSRKPLVGEFLWQGRTVFAIANHFNSKGGDDPLFGRFQPPVRSSETQRHKQAGVVAGFVEDLLEADPRAAVAVLGDLNDFQFSRTLEILEQAGLANLMKTLPANEQYSYVFDGNSQVLDQILVSKELLAPAPEYDSVHVNAEFADQASDHDPQVARVVVRGTGNAE